MNIYILEDNAERREAMQSRFKDRFPQYPIRFFVTAQEIIAALNVELDDALLISLDHDLEPESNENGHCDDPGDGRMVAEFLARRSPVCPIVIHTTNAPAAVSMETTLTDADWETHRVVPYGDLQWIDESWFPTVRNAIVGAVQPLSHTSKSISP